MAISEGNSDGYMDTIHPENRSVVGFNLMMALQAMSIGVGPVGIDIGGLTDFSLKDIKTTLIKETNNYALVQVEGTIRIPIIMYETKFCDQHDVRLYSDGEWYVDIYHPDRQKRLEKLLNERMEAESFELSDAANFCYP